MVILPTVKESKGIVYLERAWEKEYVKEGYLEFLLIMRIQNYKELFIQIENTLRKESSLSSKLFNLHFGKFKNLNYKSLLDKDIFWIIVYVTFYSGMRSSIVSQKLASIKSYFYDFKKVKDYSEKEINQILNDPKIIRHKQKINACITNALEFDKLLKKYGSFRKYLESFGSLKDEAIIDRLRADLKSKFRYLGKITVNHFLKDLGINVLKPDIVICRIFSRLGLIDHKENITQAIKVGRKFAGATGYPISYIDIIFVKYGQMGKDEYFGLKNGICLEKNPRCTACKITQYCNYYARNDNNK